MANARMDEALEMVRNTNRLAKHEITKLYDTGENSRPRYVGFKLKQPDTINLAFEVHFTGHGIFIQGDLSPVAPGGFGCCQYKTLGWFLGELSPGYLAEKFLTQGFQPELAAPELKEWVRNHADYGISEGSLRSLEEVIDELESSYPDLDCSVRLHDRLYELGLGWMCDDGVPGWGYSPTEKCWLVAIQRCFRRLYGSLNASLDSKGESPPPA